MLFLKKIIYLDPETKKETTNKEGISDKDSQELDQVLENTELQVIADLVDKSNIDEKPIVSQKVDKNNNPVFSTEAWDIRTEVKTEIMSKNKLTKLLDNAQNVLDKKSDYLRNNAEFLTVFGELADRFSKNITTKDQLKSVLWDSWYNWESLYEWEISNLFDILNTWKGWDKEKVKVLQLVMIKLNDQFHDILNQNGGIDGLAWEKTLEVLDKFLMHLKMTSEVWKTLDIKPIIALIPNKLDINLEKIKTDEVREVIFPDISKWSPFTGRINISKNNIDENKAEKQTTAEHNLWINNQVSDRVYDSNKAFDIAFNHTNWKSWMSVQINSEWMLNEVKNKKDDMILKDEFDKIMNNSINFVNKYINDNQMNEWEELNFELRPKIHTEKTPIKFKVKREWYKINVYMNNGDEPVSSRLRKWSAKISAQIWIWANGIPSQEREFENAKYGAMKAEMVKPLTNQVATKVWVEVGYADARTELNPMRDGWGYTIKNWFEFINKDNTLKTNIAMTWILDKYSQYNRNNLIFGLEANINYIPNDRLNLYGEAARNQVQGISGKVETKYKINDKIAANMWASYNQAINTPWVLNSENVAAISAWVEMKNLALSLVTSKSLYGISSKPNIWLTANIRFWN